ncbi:MAG: hypothetical protein E6J90_45760 [Deltaproteobacteria bacterium]|nr:MAG: hypothetical protein E6J90_45760 [Deltaproteobacteria bacterium]
MTAGQRLIEQGRLQGIEQGRQQGGQWLLLLLLRQRFSKDVDARIEQRVAAATFEQIKVLCTRVVSAATLADVFAD